LSAENPHGIRTIRRLRLNLPLSFRARNAAAESGLGRRTRARKRMIRRLLFGESGNMSIIMMGVMAAMALIVGGVIDYASLGNEKRSLQSVADGAALAAARELVVAKADDARVQAIAESYVAANFKSGKATTAASV